MLLIISNSQDVTADYLGTVLKQHRIKFLRLDTDLSLQQMKFYYDGIKPLIYINRKEYHPEDFTNVWYRRPEHLKHPQFDSSPEGKFILEEWAEALESFLACIEKPRWMNHPACNVAASHKIEQLIKAKSFGFRVPDTLVTHDANQLRSFYGKHNGKIIVKPMASGYIERPEGQRHSQVYTNRVMPDHLDNLDDLTNCPTLFQEYIEKRCDVRITVVDKHIHAVELTAREPDGLQRCDIRRNNMEDVAYRMIPLPRDIEQAIKILMGYYGLRFAAIDMAVSLYDDWFFFEVNPNGQWAWMDLVGKTNIAVSFVNTFSRK